ncbi:Ger(x)C family spore germination protein [Paenibacillus sp. YIM B09110]|uniref:Ger(x)C family spore germination protein n=1 Tax=Paenibacillus sp. YIM B09110 TaxID=3126102 RepID=UPI00301E600D
MNSITSRLRLFLAPLLVLCLCLPISGCWSAVELQSVSYVKAIGLDYKDNQFILYAQLLDFSNIAKSDAGGKANQDARVWVGKGRGRTLNAAANDLYKTAQMPLSWGHVSAIVISETVLKHVGIKFVEMVNRFPEVRYNTWVYGTQSSIEDILSTNSFFKLSPLTTILHDPQNNYQQYSFMPPVLLFKYLASFNEPARTTSLPCIAINSTQWKENETPQPMLTVNGAYFEYGDNINGFLSRQSLLGYRWMLKSTNRSPLTLEKDGEVYGQLSAGRPKIKIKTIIKGDEVRFHISVRLLAALYEYLEPLSNQELVAIASEIVKKQIMDTYTAGVDINVDVFQLGQHLYKKDQKLWQKLTNKGQRLAIDKQSIEKLDVNVVIPYFGKYKRLQ